VVEIFFPPRRPSNFSPIERAPFTATLPHSGALHARFSHRSPPPPIWSVNRGHSQSPTTAHPHRGPTTAHQARAITTFRRRRHGSTMVCASTRGGHE
jgi:hypothetical protein